jgi:hypothetical protein
MTRRIEEASGSDPVRQRGGRGQQGKVGPTGRATRGVHQDRIDADQGDGHGGHDVLHMGPGQSIGARSSHPHSPHSLGKRAFTTGTQSRLLPELRHLLHVSLGLEGFMSRLRTHMQDAASRLGSGAVLAHRTRGTGLGGKTLSMRSPAWLTRLLCCP